MTAPHFIVFDLETTSRDAATAHVIEWAAVEMLAPLFDGTSERRHGSLVRPPIAIPPETSAVHHIVDADVATAATWDEARLTVAARMRAPGTIAGAHNADYERTILGDLSPATPWLCTYKAALRVWPEAPGFGNECLRYWLGFGSGRRYAQAPHSALHDAKVTAQLLGALLKHASAEDMIAWTKEPALLPRCPIGQYRDLPWPDVPRDFLDWILYRAREMREDIKFCARKEIERRDAEWSLRCANERSRQDANL